MKGLIHLPLKTISSSENSPAFLESDLRTSNFHLDYQISSDRIVFNLTRFDGNSFHKPSYALSLFESELKASFFRLVLFLESQL